MDGVKIVSYSSNTLQDKHFRTKPSTPTYNKNYIYTVSCELGEFYIGESKRPLEIRISEHQSHTKKGEATRSGIAKDAWIETS